LLQDEEDIAEVIQNGPGYQYQGLWKEKKSLTLPPARHIRRGVCTSDTASKFSSLLLIRRQTTPHLKLSPGNWAKIVASKISKPIGAGYLR
jgi:hypothetical protein